MPLFTQSTETRGDLPSDLLAGSGHHVIDLEIDASQTITVGEVVSFDATAEAWTTYNAADPYVGVALQDATTGVGESAVISVLLAGPVLRSKLTGVPAAADFPGAVLGLVIMAD